MAKVSKLASAVAAVLPFCCFQSYGAPTSMPARGTSAVADTEPSVTPVPARFRVERFEFQGNTRFSAGQLAEVAQATLTKVNPQWVHGRDLSTDDLEEIRLALTKLYVDSGHINSGAVIPAQPIDRGVVLFKIEEGTISDVRVTFRNGKEPVNRHLLRAQYVVSRMQLASQPPLNILRLKDELEILRQDPNIKAINAELKPGTVAGQSTLDVQVEENNPFQLGLQFSNRRPPSVGSTAIDLIARDSDLTGRGDLFAVRFDVMNGPIDDLQLDGARDFSLSYSIPFTPADTTFTVDFNRTNTLVQEQDFQQLHISSESDSLSFTVRQPLYRKPTADAGTPEKPGSPSVEFDIFGVGSLRDNRTGLLGRPFAFGSGDINGGEHVTALRFGQELTLRSERNAFSGRSTFSLGVPWFDSTPQVRSAQPGGRFFDWVGQAQFIHLIANTDIQFIVRGSAQISDRPLLTLEQFSLGGVETVRGYPENFLLRDSALTGTIEFHAPVAKKGDFEIDVIPFFDAGYGWNRTGALRRTEAIDSVGIGLSASLSRHFSMQIFYGSALQHHARDTHDIENLGLHFNMLMQAF